MLGFGLEGAEVADPCLPTAVNHVLGDSGSAPGYRDSSMEAAVAPVAEVGEAILTAPSISVSLPSCHQENMAESLTQSPPEPAACCQEPSHLSLLHIPCQEPSRLSLSRVPCSWLLLAPAFTRPQSEPEQ